MTRVWDVRLRALRAGTLTLSQAEKLLPQRSELAMVWRYLSAIPGEIREAPMCLCRKIVRWTGQPLSLGKLMACLDIFADVELLQLRRFHKYISIRLCSAAAKADLNRSQTMQRLLQRKES